MPRSKRAAQFAMFDALKGLKEAIAVKERYTEPRKILADDAAEELNKALSHLEKGNMATLVFYNEPEQVYKQLTGLVSKIDPIWKYVQIGSVSVRFSDLYQVSA